MGEDRREQAMAAALELFARTGFRQASMSRLAVAMDVSRPTAYAWFGSKEQLFRQACEQSLERDLAACEAALGDPTRTLGERVLEAFDHWAGHYVGPLTREVPQLIETHPELLGPVARTAPRVFEDLLTTAVAESTALSARPARETARTLISTSIGIKHQVETGARFRARMRIAVDLVLR